MAEDPREQTWLVSAAIRMLVDDWSVVDTREKRQAQAQACFGPVLFCLPLLSRTATAFECLAKPSPDRAPDADCRAPALSKPCAVNVPAPNAPLRHLKAVVDLCDFWFCRVLMFAAIQCR
jgi:hypothetical protein